MAPSSPCRRSGRRKQRSSPVDWFGLLQVAGVLVLCAGLWIAYKTRKAAQVEWHHVEEWLQAYDLHAHHQILYDLGIRRLEDVLKTDFVKNEALQSLSLNVRLDLQEAASAYVDLVTLEQWLKDAHLESYMSKLKSASILSLMDLANTSPAQLASMQRVSFGFKEHQDFLSRVNELRSNGYHLQVKSRLWSEFMEAIQSHKWTISGLMMVVLLTGLVMVLSNNNYAAYIAHHSRSKHSVVELVTGKYLSPHHCKVIWDWDEPRQVGETVTFRIKFFQRNGRPYKISAADQFFVEIMMGSIKVPCSVAFLKADQPSSSHGNVAKVSFTVHKSGQYRIVLMVAGSSIKGSPFHKTFLPGPIDPSRSGFLHQSSVVICQRGVAHQLQVEPRDEYGNPCADSCNQSQLSGYSIQLTEIGSNRVYTPQLQASYERSLNCVLLQLCLDEEGCYKAKASYQKCKLNNGDFNILSLSSSSFNHVNKSVAKKSHNVFYEARLVSHNHERLDKGKKVYCYISPKQLTIKEYIMKIFPKRLFTFRVCPSTKFQFLGLDSHYDTPSVLIEDGCQAPIEITTKDRDVIAAVFTVFLLKNIGGSETFKDKQDFFYHEVRQLHAKRLHERLPIKINRHDLLHTSMKATKNFSTSDWCRSFEVHFIGEQGVDWGGLRREWVEILSQALFSTGTNTLFTKFKEDNQALIHPSPCPPNLKMKHYEFAGRIVGKCLYESALGGIYKQYIKARFSRSFLAQLIGLRVNYKYFEQDDPELYDTKIKYIEENDVNDMELVFAEEEYKDGRIEKVTELIPNGSKIAVTNENKTQYLNSLAQFKLARRVQDEIEAFLKGLNELIPDNLLSIFDENELELLICGSSSYSITELRENHVVSGSSVEFRQVLDWFWIIVSSLSQEDMGRLLQFTTGCSLLPPGGFSQLNPKFQITSAPTYGNLPTAHTCFNQLCLPTYKSMEEMQSALMIAIREGNQGFALV